MTTLQALKHLINFSFLIFIISTFLVFVAPLILDIDQQENSWQLLVYLGVHFGIIFMILFFLRKFVQNSFEGNPFDKSTRIYLKRAGIFCLIYGLIEIYDVSGTVSFYFLGGELNGSLVTNGFLDFGALCFTILIGLFFIYLSKVLEISAIIKQENQLTI